MKSITFAAAATVILFGTATPSHADTSTPHSWLWPLYEPALDTSGNLVQGRPRRIIFNSLGDVNDNLHPGIDIMANHANALSGVPHELPDVTMIPVDSTLLRIYDHDDCGARKTDSTTYAFYCRLWFSTFDGKYLYYMAHVHYNDGAVGGDVEVNIHLREVIVNSLGGTTSKDANCTGNCDFKAGDLGPTISSFVPTGFDHLHFDIVDPHQDYDLVNPLKYLKQTAQGHDGRVFDTVDSVAPTLNEIALVPDAYNSVTRSVIYDGTCGPEVKGVVDISANAWDDTSTPALEKTAGALDIEDPLASVHHMGLYKATYAVTCLQDLQTRVPVQSGTWYEFDQAPMFCPGPLRGNACQFAEQQIGSDNLENFGKYLECKGNDLSGSPPGPGYRRTSPDICAWSTDGYNDRLYRSQLQDGPIGAEDEHRYLIVTNEWGTDTDFYPVSGYHTNWDTTKGADGRYQVDVIAYDIDGHTAGRSLLVNVHNSAGPLNLGGGVPNDIYMRDSDRDVGAVPSNLGGQPFWNSPDILVVSSGAGPDTSKRTDQVMEGRTYDVWVQVHYPVCNGLSGVKVRLASANPSTFIDSSKWKSITKTGFEVPQGSPADGVPLLPNSTDQWIGPFSWIPGSDEIGTDGHRCLLAAVTSEQDPTSVSDMVDVPGHNNVAQRNVQIGTAMKALFANPYATRSQVGLRLSSRDMPVFYRLVFDYDAALESPWMAAPNVGVAHVGSNLEVTIKANDVSLPAVGLDGYVEKDFTVTADDPEGRMFTVNMTANVNGQDVGGMTFVYSNPIQR